MKHAFLALALAFASPALAQHAGHDAHKAAPAGDHGMTIKASIAEGAVLTEAPKTLTLTFEPAMRLASARLVTLTGEIVPVTFDKAAPAGGSATISFAPLTTERYVLTYAADAGDHLMTGAVRFTVK
jgi:methionine-rich copper-binding protein CopC